ncbi:MAG: DNA polymerase/3'-5' exonuclease PolX [Spirochaetota bacterium]|nr:MAG: DNA polymerase/3'-5' exonuclease PolX [Spirochaetota bacterium]
MEKVSNKDIASVLKDIALYKELKGENPFKVRAFEQAAHTVEIHPSSIAKLAEAGSLQEIKGVGKGVADVISEFVERKKSSMLEELKSSFPPTISDLFRIPGMGPKKIKAVWEKLGCSTIGELEYACLENRLVTLDGFGQRSQEKILKAIEFIKRHRDRHLISEAFMVAKEVIENLSDNKLCKIATIAGSLRRGKSTFKDIDILIVSDTDADDQRFKETLLKLADEDGVISAGSTKVSIRRQGIQIDFRIVAEQCFPSALQHFTGSKEHNTILRSRAKTLGMKMNEYGLFKGEDSLQVADEQELYRSIGLEYIPPEIREGEDEVGASLEGKLPELIEQQNLHGMVHVHSTYSDGMNTIEQLAEECHRQGYSYLCISDHSKSAFYANGLSIQALHAQINEVRELNKKLSPFRIFCGIESDILSDGGLDYPEDALSKLDFVIGSIHSKLTMDSNEATSRLVAALQNPHLTILGHPSGRLLLSREGYQYNEEMILDALMDNGVAIEHNCNPHRLDPEWRFLKSARERGILVSINPDAHSIEGFGDMGFGLVMARKAWLEKQDVLNCMNSEEIDGFFRGRKQKKGI